MPASHIRVQREPVDATIGRLDTFVRRLEARYECPSEAMVSAIGAGLCKETAEISQWLAAHRTLNRLRDAAGQGTGMNTRTTS